MSVMVDRPAQPPLKWSRNALQQQRNRTGGAPVVRDGVVITVVPQGSPADVALKNQQQRQKKARAIAEARKQKKTAARKATEKKERAAEKNKESARGSKPWKGKQRRRKPSAKRRATQKRNGEVWE